MSHAKTRKRGSRKMVTTGAVTSRKLASVDANAEVTYWRVYMASDKYGTLSGDAWDVWQLALPGKHGFTEATVAAALDDLVSASLLERWQEPDGTRWVHVIGHDLHQQAAWIARRGERQTPIPPSQRYAELGEYVPTPDPMCADARETTPKACERTHPSPDAGSVPIHAIACAPTTTPTPSTTSTTTPGGGIAGAAEPQTPSAGGGVPTPLPSDLEAACHDAARTGPRAEWWITSVQKLRGRDLSAPDAVFLDAVDWCVTEADGGILATTRAWAMLRGAVKQGIDKHRATPAAAPERKNRSWAEVQAEQDAIWGTAS